MRNLPKLDTLIRKGLKAHFVYYLDNEFWYSITDPSFLFSIPREEERVYIQTVDTTEVAEYIISQHRREELEQALEQI